MTTLAPKIDWREIETTPEVSGYARLLGPEAWTRLSPSIRRRFSYPMVHDSVTYAGTMHRVEMSGAGHLLAQLCRLIGTPLPYRSGRNVPTRVNVYHDKLSGGMVWDRCYTFAGDRRCRVRSTKMIKRDEGLVELVGCGFGMYLEISEEDNNLVFTSNGYFLEAAGRRLPIPDVLTPGQTRVCQADLGDGHFRFELSVEHPVLGQTYYQVGVFKAV